MSHPPEEPDDDGNSRAPAVIGLVVVLALVLIAYFVVNSLRETSNLQDCVMSGRTNCAPITPGGR